MKPVSDYPYGEVLQNISMGGLTLQERIYPSLLNLPKHSHQHAYFCFVLGGSFTETYGSRSRSCGASTLVFNPAGEIHSDLFHTGSRCFNIQMGDDWLKRWNTTRMIEIPADFTGGQSAQRAAELYREFRELDEYSSLAVEGLALEILAEACRQHNHKSRRLPPRWLNNARDIIRERYREPLGLLALARTVNVHPAHLAREFRRFYGCTMGEFARQRRIEFACRQLSASDASLSEVALAAGFFDQSHFTRSFKRYTGVTPREYRAASGARKSRTNAQALCKTRNTHTL